MTRSTTNPADDLINLEMAIIDRCHRLRLPHWPNPYDYIEIIVQAGVLAPWVDLWSLANITLNNRNPVRIPWAIILPRLDITARVWLPYGGPAGTPYDEPSPQGRPRQGEGTDTGTTTAHRAHSGESEVEPPQEHPIGGYDRGGITEAEARESEDEREHSTDNRHHAATDT